MIQISENKMQLKFHFTKDIEGDCHWLVKIKLAKTFGMANQWKFIWAKFSSFTVLHTILNILLDGQSTQYDIRRCYIKHSWTKQKVHVFPILTMTSLQTEIQLCKMCTLQFSLRSITTWQGRNPHGKTRNACS